MPLCIKGESWPPLQKLNPYMYLYLHHSLDEHAMTESAYARIICMYELLTVIKMEDPTDV